MRAPAGSGAGERAAGGARQLHRLPPRHRRAAARVRGRPLRGDRGAHLRRAAATRSSPLPRGERRRRRRGRRPAPARAGARQPPRDGARDPRARRSPRRARTRSRSTAARWSTRSSPNRSASSASPGRAWRPREPGCSWARATRPRACGRRSRDPGLPQRTRLGPPGVDVARFRPREQRRGGRRGGRRSPPPAGARPRRSPAAARRAPSPATRARPARRSRGWRREDLLVAFVGKLIVSKGPDLLLAAWPLVLERLPAARLLIVGFGAFRGGLERARRGPAGRGPRARPGARPRRAPPGGRGGSADAAAATCWPSWTAFAGADRGALPSRRDGALASGSCSPAAWSTRSSPSCCPPAARWWSPAPSPRPSGWSPPRPPPAGRCRSAPPTRASRRSASARSRTSRTRSARCCPSSSDHGAVAALAAAAGGVAGPASRSCASAHARGLVATVRERWSWEQRGRGRDRGGRAGSSRGSPSPERPAAQAGSRPGRAHRRVRIVFAPASAQDPPQRTAFALAARSGCVAADGAARARRRARRPRRRQLLLGEGRRQRQPDRRQAAVRGQVRRLPHARPGRHEGDRRAEPRRRLRARASKKACSRNAIRSVVEFQIVLPEPDRARCRRTSSSGADRQGRRRLRRKSAAAPGPDTRPAGDGRGSPRCGQAGGREGRQAGDRRQPPGTARLHLHEGPREPRAR